MRAQLIYNPDAGGAGRPSVEELLEWLGDAGYDPFYGPTKSEEELDKVLEDAKGLIVAAGGDGTVRALAKHLAYHDDLRLTVLPLGSANNIASTLGITGNVRDVIQGLRHPIESEFDMGYTRGPWGEEYFLEGTGFGFFADLLATYDPDKGKNFFRSVSSFVKTLQESKIYECNLRIDDRELSGEFLLVEMLNADAVGPRLKFAPDADPTDGLLDVVLIRKSDREGLLSYLDGLVGEDLERLGSVDATRAKEIELCWTGFPFHMDAVVKPDWVKDPDSYEPGERWRSQEWDRPCDDGSGVLVTVRAIPGALKLLLPEQTERND